MGISSTTNRVAYTGDGSSTIFAFPYEFFNTSDLAVYLYNVGSSLVQSQTLNTNYTIAGSINSQGIYPSGGSVVMTSSVPTTHQVIIARNPSPINNYVLNQNGQISSLALVQQLDYLTTLVQRHTDQISRAILLPDGIGTINGQAFDQTLPQMTPLLTSANAPLVLNSSALGWTYGLVALGGSSAVSYFGTLPVVNGGTGQSLGLNPSGVWYSLNGSTMAQTQAGPPGYLLTGQGSSAPTFQLLNVASSVTGVLGVSSGGTGTGTSYIQYGVLFASSATQIANTNLGGTDQVLLGQGIAAPVFGAVNLASNSSVTNSLPFSKVSGLVPIGQGGTNASAFTQSWVLFASSTTQIGAIDPTAAGKALISNGSAAPSFQAITVTNTVSTKTADYVTTNADSRIIAASSLFTIYLYKPQASDAGKNLDIVKLTTFLDFNRVIVQGSNCTIASNAGVVNSTAIHTLGERIQVYPDNSGNWVLNDRFASFPETNLGSSVITSSGGGAIKASSILSDNFWASRQGNHLLWRYEFHNISAGVAGTGDYQLTFPNGIQCDTTKVIVNSGVYGAANPTSILGVIAAGGGNTSATVNPQFAYPLNATTFKIWFSGGGVWSAGFAAMSSTNTNISVSGKFPVPEWNS